MIMKRYLLAVVIGVGVALPAWPGAAAATPPAPVAYLRLAHISPDTPTVDVYLASVSDPGRAITVPGVDYGNMTDYQAVAIDTYTVSMRPAGAPADSPPVITTTLTTEPGAAYTVAGTGLRDDLALTVLDDELGMPPAGNARIRVINAAATAPVVDLSVTGGPVIADGLAFAESTGYQTVPTGSRTVAVTTPGGGPPTTVPVTMAGNATYTVLLLDRDGGLRAQLYLDSAAAGTVPSGGVDTGLGGAAPPRR